MGMRLYQIAGATYNGFTPKLNHSMHADAVEMIQLIVYTRNQTSPQVWFLLKS